MKKFLHIFMAFLVVVLCTSATLQKGDKKKKDKMEPEAAQVYGFGFASSFIDTLAFYTDIQLLDSAKLVDGKYLDQRYQYSYQLKDYLAVGQNKPDYVCMIFFNKDKKKLQKEYDKLLAKYRKSGLGLRAIAATDFKFKQPE